MSLLVKDASATRQKIRDTALRLFVEQGVGGTSVRDLAQAAGIAEGTLYRHYESKDALTRDLFMSHYAAFAGRLDGVQRNADGFHAQLWAMVTTICGLYDSDPLLFRFLLLVQHEALPHVVDGPDNPVAVLRKTIARAIQGGEISLADADLGTGFVLGLLIQPAVLLVYGRLHGPFANFAPEIADACWRALNPPAGESARRTGGRNHSSA